MAINKKLLEFQKQGITITKDGANPHYKSKYSTLNEVLNKVTGPLNALGVVIIQKTGTGLAPDIHGLYTTLSDTEDDTDVSSFVPFIGATDMQKLGGAITYARRYSLVTLLGLEDEDDDGETASKPMKPKSVVEAKGEPFASKPRTVPTLDDSGLVDGEMYVKEKADGTDDLSDIGF